MHEIHRKVLLAAEQVEYEIPPPTWSSLVNIINLLPSAGQAHPTMQLHSSSSYSVCTCTAGVISCSVRPKNRIVALSPLSTDHIALQHAICIIMHCEVEPDIIRLKKKVQYMATVRGLLGLSATMKGDKSKIRSFSKMFHNVAVARSLTTWLTKLGDAWICIHY